jgi:hypothetical protein
MNVDETVFRASRWKVSLLIAACVFFGSAQFWPDMLGSVRDDGGDGILAPFRLLDPDWRVLLFQGVCWLFIGGGFLFVPVLVDNQVVFINDEGILVRIGLGRCTGRWADLVALKSLRTVLRSHVSFCFQPGGPNGGQKRLSVPMPVGVDREAVLKEADRRLSRLHAVPTQRPVVQANVSLAVSRPPSIQRDAVFGRRRPPSI